MISSIPSLGAQVFDNIMSLSLVVSQGSVLTILGFAYPNETLTAPSGASYQWYVNDVARGTDQTLVLSVNDIGLVVRCVVGVAECNPVTVWHPRDISNVKSFWWAAQGSYNTIANGVTDDNASLIVTQPTNSTITRAIGGDLNSKAAYGNNIGMLDTLSTWCYWDGSQWILNVAFDSGDNPLDFTYFSSSPTAFPWEATWDSFQTVTRQATIVDALASDGQAVTYWKDLITNINVTAFSNNIALYEQGDLPTPSLKFDNTDFFTIPSPLRNVFNLQNYGYIFAGVKDTDPTAVLGGDLSAHGVVSINRTTTFPKMALVTRYGNSASFGALTTPNDSVLKQAAIPNDSNYNVLTNETKWVDGEINLRVNGNLSDSEAFTPAIPTTAINAQANIGAYTSSTTTNFIGYMTAIILANGLMSNTDRNRIERFIGLLGGLNIALTEV